MSRIRDNGFLICISNVAKSLVEGSRNATCASFAKINIVSVHGVVGLKLKYFFRETVGDFTKLCFRECADLKISCENPFD
jgi:hypothetical protein